MIKPRFSHVWRRLGPEYDRERIQCAGIGILKPAKIFMDAQLGSQTYTNALPYDGKIFIATINEAERNPKLKGDRGVIMAFDQQTGKFLWQSTHEKLPSGMVNDWPLQGICSTPFVEGKRLWYVSNRCEIVCRHRRFSRWRE
ncbi:MAG: hypothetical protein R3C26_16980 [Calditrichia bacterium]